jgi:hypothetical protein
MLTRDAAEEHLRVAGHREVVRGGRTGWDRRDRLNLGGRLRFLHGIGGDIVCLLQLLLELLDLLLVLLVRLLVLLMDLFELLDFLVQLLDRLLERLELFISDRRRRGSERYSQRASGS